ncbi:unnamed protein product [Lepeophtheirus salmonis]|uniref:(salmon louse) hypothetical protein n=1 Tax=Lepeophtheirus salmonis TaxID=72036 RepID=A0A7R8HEJ1_LEPSM|nr:unnamed protein product [Lepeophtheirus salmonis]CAF3045708.1 unnamed protein product [Lepeophtheirus salmonis]
MNYNIVFSFPALSINIIDPDWYKWNNGSDVLHKGKYVSLTEKESIGNTFGLPSEEKLSMGPLKYIDACRSCRHLHGDGNVTPDGKNLILTKCLENEFSCNDGFCIPMNLVCNNSPDCSDALDEEDCSIVDTLGYRKEFPPILTSKSEKSLVNITFHLKSINSIKEMKSMYDISFIIELQWKDPRLSFNNLNSYEQNDDVRFTMDRDVQISATKILGTNGTLNSVSELKKKLKYSGENVILKLKVSKMMSMLCVFDFHQYPFDNQKCKVEIGLTLEVQEQVALNILRDMYTSFDHIDLLQYNMKNLTFELVESKGIVVIELQRMFNNILWTTYFPTFFLQIVAILTLFFPSNRFDTTVMITITTTFVNYTLYQSVSISLPSTAYNKMIDYWLFSSSHHATFYLCF